MCWRGENNVSKKEVTISRIYNNQIRVLYYFYLTLFCRKSRLYFGGRRAIPIACRGRSAIGVVVEFRLVHSVLTSRTRTVDCVQMLIKQNTLHNPRFPPLWVGLWPWYICVLVWLRFYNERTALDRDTWSRYAMTSLAWSTGSESEFDTRLRRQVSCFICDYFIRTNIEKV